MPDQALLTVQPHAEALWAVVQRPRLDDLAAADLNAQVLACAEQRPGLPVVLDLSAVEYVPSLGLGSLVTLLRALRQQSRRFILVGLRPEVRGTLTVTRLDKLFEIQPTFEDALTRLQGQP